jgi:dGTPase
MFGAMFDRLLSDVVTRDESSPIFKHHVTHICRKSRALTPEKYLAQDPDMIVADYLASMTDSYFIALYAHLFPRSARRLEYRGYFDDLP